MRAHNPALCAASGSSEGIRFGRFIWAHTRRSIWDALLGTPIRAPVAEPASRPGCLRFLSAPCQFSPAPQLFDIHQDDDDPIDLVVQRAVRVQPESMQSSLLVLHLE